MFISSQLGSSRFNPLGQKSRLALCLLRTATELSWGSSVHGAATLRAQA